MKKRLLALALAVCVVCVTALATGTAENETAILPPSAGAEAPSTTAGPEAPAQNTSAPASASEPASPAQDTSAPASTSEPAPTSVEPASPAANTANNPFTDVKPTSVFLPGILYAVEKGITNGTTRTTFSPSETCTRAQILTFLWRACGSPVPGAENPFTDILPAAYYYQAALWAAEKGLVSGDKFQPYAPCSRLEAVTYLWKLAGAPVVTDSASLPFTDVGTDADALNAVAWAVSNGVTNGTSKTTFAPNNTCTRGQIVTFLYRARDLLQNL